MTKAYGMQLIASLLEEQNIANLHKIDSEKLTETELEVFDYVMKHVMEYAVLPKVSTVETAVVCNFTSIKEPFKFYENKVKDRYLQKTINSMMMQVQEELVAKNPQQAAEIMVQHISKLTQIKHASGIVDFRHAAKLVAIAYHEKQKISLGKGIKTGWNYLDGMMGGMEPGDFLSIIGRPASGKTFLLLFMARNAWRFQGKIPLIISPEMKPIQLIQRLSACEAQKNLSGLQTATYATKTYGKVMECLHKLEGEEFPFYIVDGRVAPTIEDAYLLCRQLNPGCLYYDGAYMMKFKDKRMSKWDRIGASAYGLKDIAMTCDIPTVASYQFNKDVIKKSKSGKKEMKKADEIGLEDIYGSDEIGQVSSVALGMLEAEGIKTLKKREVSVLKGRNGEIGSFKINWDFQYMDFSEIHAKPSPSHPNAPDDEGPEDTSQDLTNV